MSREPGTGTTILSSREFNHDTGRAKTAAEKGPVIITHRGRPSHVLLTVDDYEKLTGRGPSIVDLLAMPEGAEIAFDVPKLRGPQLRAADLI